MSSGRYTHAKNVTKQSAHVIEKRQGHEAEDANKKDAYPRRPVLQSIQFFSGVIDSWYSREILSVWLALGDVSRTNYRQPSLVEINIS